MDGGDFIHRNGLENALESRLTWDEMIRSGYHAVTLGELEFGQWTLVDSLLQHTSMPVVCTNVEVLRDGRWEQLGERFRVVEVNDVRVGILGVIGPGQLSPGVIQGTGGCVRLLPAAETVQAAASEIAGRTDVIVLLAHVDPQTMEQYATTLTDVDVVLGGHMTRLDTGPLLSARAIVNRSSTRGQHVAVTRVIVPPEGGVVDFGGANVTLDPDFPEDPEVAQAAQLAEEESKRLARERTKKRQGDVRPTSAPAGDGEGKGGGTDTPAARGRAGR